MARKPEIVTSSEEWHRIVQSAASLIPDDFKIRVDPRLDAEEMILEYFDDLADGWHVRPRQGS